MKRERDLRARLVERLELLLLSRGAPRFEMTLMVLATACAGFLCSVLLLHYDLQRMWLRYSIAVGVAYLVFLGLIYLWLRLARVDADIDLDDLNVNPLDAVEVAVEVSGMGAPAPPAPLEAPPSGAESSGSGLGIDLDAEAVWVVVLLLSAVGVAVLASVYVISQAPVLLAEVLVDGAFCAGLYRRLRRLERRDWLESAVIRTRFPLLWVLLFFLVAGFAMQAYAPEAVSIGGVWDRLRVDLLH